MIQKEQNQKAKSNLKLLWEDYNSFKNEPPTNINKPIVLKKEDEDIGNNQPIKTGVWSDRAKAIIKQELIFIETPELEIKFNELKEAGKKPYLVKINGYWEVKASQFFYFDKDPIIFPDEEFIETPTDTPYEQIKDFKCEAMHNIKKDHLRLYHPGKDISDTIEWRPLDQKKFRFCEPITPFIKR